MKAGLNRIFLLFSILLISAGVPYTGTSGEKTINSQDVIYRILNSHFTTSGIQIDGKTESCI